MKTNPELDQGEHWSTAGACVELVTQAPETFDQYFFPTKYTIAAVQMAKRICQACPVQVECLEDALVNRESDGVRGGTTPYERQMTRRHRPRDAA